MKRIRYEHPCYVKYHRAILKDRIIHLRKEERRKRREDKNSIAHCTLHFQKEKHENKPFYERGSSAISHMTGMEMKMETIKSIYQSAIVQKCKVQTMF